MNSGFSFQAASPEPQTTSCEGIHNSNSLHVSENSEDPRRKLAQKSKAPKGHALQPRSAEQDDSLVLGNFGWMLGLSPLQWLSSNGKENGKCHENYFLFTEAEARDYLPAIGHRHTWSLRILGSILRSLYSWKLPRI